MCQHVRDRRPTCTNEADIQAPKCEVSPSSTDVDKLVPPAFATPILLQDIAIFFLPDNAQSTEIKYVEKRIIVELVDGYPKWTDYRTGLLTGR